MKTAISLPDDVFRGIEACAKRLKLSRSGVLAAAAREFLARHPGSNDATEAWNRAIAAAGQPGSDPAAASFRGRTKTVVRGAGEW
jgi:predicted transcriptional regulator